MRNASERSPRFVKRDMTVGTYAEYLNILLHNGKKGVVSVAFRFSVRRFTVFDISVFKVYIDMVEEIVPHKVDVTLIARIIETRIFVEVYRFNAFITRTVFLVVLYHIFIKTYGGRTRSES